jgi:hypothetical protein
MTLGGLPERCWQKTNNEFLDGHSEVIGNWDKTISFRTGRGAARKTLFFPVFELAYKGSKEDSGTGLRFARNRRRVQAESKRGQFKGRGSRVSDAVST